MANYSLISLHLIDYYFFCYRNIEEIEAEPAVLSPLAPDLTQIGSLLQTVILGEQLFTFITLKNIVPFVATALKSGFVVF